LLPAVPAIKAVRAELFTTLTLGSGFVGSATADLLGSDFSLTGERICGGSLINFYSAALVTKSEFWSSAITIDIHLLDPDVDRSIAEYEECRLEWTWILIGTSGGGVEILNLSEPPIT
jgi:hypothetical protein